MRTRSATVPRSLTLQSRVHSDCEAEGMPRLCERSCYYQSVLQGVLLTPWRVRLGMSTRLWRVRLRLLASHVPNGISYGTESSGTASPGASIAANGDRLRNAHGLILPVSS